MHFLKNKSALECIRINNHQNTKMQNIVRIISTECPDEASFGRIFEDERLLTSFKQLIVSRARNDIVALKINLRTQGTDEIIGSFKEIVKRLQKIVFPVGIKFYNSIMKEVLSEIAYSMDAGVSFLPYVWGVNEDFKLHAVAFSKNLSEIIRKIHVLLAFAGARCLARIGSLSAARVFPADLIKYLIKFL